MEWCRCQDTPPAVCVPLCEDAGTAGHTGALTAVPSTTVTHTHTRAPLPPCGPQVLLGTEVSSQLGREEPPISTARHAVEGIIGSTVGSRMLACFDTAVRAAAAAGAPAPAFGGAGVLAAAEGVGAGGAPGSVNPWGAMSEAGAGALWVASQGIAMPVARRLFLLHEKPAQSKAVVGDVVHGWLRPAGDDVGTAYLQRLLGSTRHKIQERERQYRWGWCCCLGCRGPGVCRALARPHCGQRAWWCCLPSSSLFACLLVGGHIA